MNLLVFLDSNVFIWGYNRPESNSGKILELMDEGRITIVVSEKVIEDIRTYFLAHYTKDVWSAVFRHVSATAKIVLHDELHEDIRKLKGKINEKDIEHLATARMLRLEYLISYDRNFKKVREHLTPRQFVKRLGLKASNTEY